MSNNDVSIVCPTDCSNLTTSCSSSLASVYYTNARYNFCCLCCAMFVVDLVRCTMGLKVK